MTNIKMAQKLSNFEKALKRFQIVLNTPLDANKIVIEASIQCFEFCYELTWKTLKTALEQDGLKVGTPRDVFKEAYAVRWISDEEIWLKMLDDRNLTSHTYNEKIALAIYEHLKNYEKLNLKYKQ